MRVITAWIAGLGSFIIPGLGFIYCRHFLLAYLVIPILLLPGFVIGWSGWIFDPGGASVYLLTTVLLMLTIVVSSTVLSVRHARQGSNKVAWFHYPLFIVFALGLFNPLSVNFIREKLAGFNYYRVSSSAMSPTLNRGDIVVVDTWRYKVSEVEKNDVVLFTPPKTFADQNSKWLMRVVARHGDSVDIIDSHVEVNGELMKEGVVLGDAVPDAQQRLDKDAFFVMGDNRRNSNDSRYWGLLPHSQIHGKARVVVYTDSGGFTHRNIRAMK